MIRSLSDEGVSLRILVAHSYYRTPGGENRYVDELVELLRPYHEVELLGPSNEELSGSFGTVQQMTFSRSAISDVTDRIKAFKPDVIHMHNAYPSLGPSVVEGAAKTRVPLVMTVHNYRLRCPNGYQFTQGKICRRCIRGNYANAVLHDCFPTKSQAAGYALALWVHRFVLRLEKGVSRFVVPSIFMKEKLTDWRIPRECITVVPNFVRSEATVASSPGEFGLFAGRLSDEKGVDLLLDALHLAGDPPFVILGDGPARTRLEAKAQMLGLSSVRFGGMVSPEIVKDHLRQARYVTVPSVWEEPFGLVAAEAMAVGTPVVATRQGALGELVDVSRGAIADPPHAQVFAEAIRSFMEDDTLCVARGRAAWVFARTHLAPELHRLRLEDVYSNAANA